MNDNNMNDNNMNANNNNTNDMNMNDNNTNNNGANNNNNVVGEHRYYRPGVELHNVGNGHQMVVLRDGHGLEGEDINAMFHDGVPPPLLVVGESRPSCDFCDAVLTPFTVANHMRNCQEVLESGESLEEILSQRWECGYCSQIVTTNQIRHHLLHCSSSPTQRRFQRNGR